MTTIICGVDVSSANLDARIGMQGKALRVERTAAGIDELAAFCHENAVDLLVMEASGGYEKLPFALLWGRGIPCAIANPRSVRRFAEAMGLLEKTDRIDAGLIAGFAKAKGLVPVEPDSQAQKRLKALVTRLRQLTACHTLQLNQARLVEDEVVRASITEVVVLLKRQMRRIEAAIAELIEQDPLWTALAAAFRQIKGVAGRATARLLADMAEIGTISNKAAAKLVGLAPIANDSGKIGKRRRIRGGRAPLRAILFTIAEIVRRHNRDFQAFHQRLLAAGKPRKLIRVALARKLIVQLNAKARDARAALPTRS